MTDQLISVVIPTRDRAAHFPACVEAVLANSDPAFNVVIVDQSEDDATERALAAMEPDDRVIYRRTGERGVARARNLGWRLTSAPLIAYTDDDCRVGPDWLAGLRARMDHQPDVAVLYAPVRLPDVVEVGGFGSAFEPIERVYQGSLPGPKEPWGISANMMVRRAALERLSGFDELLGAGGVFKSGAETDLTVRAIAAGYTVVHCCASPVLHLGVRAAAEARPLMQRYAFGMGAMFGKHFRLRTRPGWSQLPRWLAHYTATVATNAVLRRRPLRAVWLQGMVTGAWASWRTPIDRSTGHYRHPSAGL